MLQISLPFENPMFIRNSTVCSVYVFTYLPTFWTGGRQLLYKLLLYHHHLFLLLVFRDQMPVQLVRNEHNHHHNNYNHHHHHKNNNNHTHWIIWSRFACQSHLKHQTMKKFLILWNKIILQFFCHLIKMKFPYHTKTVTYCSMVHCVCMFVYSAQWHSA